VFISVVAGTMTFYDSDDPACEPTVRTAGRGFLTSAITRTSREMKKRSRANA
jgi:hypothetical protein